MPKAVGILALFLLSPLCGIGGNFVYISLNRRFGVSAKTLLLASMLFITLIPAYGLVGFASTSFGVRHGWEIIVVAAWYGFHFAGYLAFTRSVFATLVPPGQVGSTKGGEDV